MSEKQSIKIGDQVVEVDPALFREYVKETLSYLDEITVATDAFKEAVGTMEETFNIDKKVIAKFLKQKHKEKLEASLQEAEDLDALNHLM